MGITKYEVNGKEYWKIYITLRSKRNRKIRVQKRVTLIESMEEALKLDKKWFQWACEQVAKRESEGFTWGEIVDCWRIWYRKYPSPRWDEGTVRDYIAITNNWTHEWLNRPVSKITVSDGYEMLEKAKAEGASQQRLYQIRTTVNVIFKWAMGAGKIHGKDHSPVFGIDVAKKSKSEVPEILNRDQFIDLLERARKAEHEYYPVWKVDAHTGLRAAELEGLRKEDIEMVSRNEAMELDRSSGAIKNYGTIRVQRQWKNRLKKYGDLKGRYWRTVPISSQLYWFLDEYLKNDFGSDEHGRRVFPILKEMRHGHQAKVLRAFCESEGLKGIKFHTLRACFATHLLAAGVPEAKVMKIGGWKDRETMMIYVRLAGVDEAGATEALDLSPKPESLPQIEYSNVVSLFQSR